MVTNSTLRPIQVDNPDTSLSILHALVTAGRLRPLDYAFATFIIEHDSAPQATDERGIHVVGLLAAYLSSRLGEQDTCLDLANISQPFLPFYRFAAPAQLTVFLTQSSCVSLVTKQHKGQGKPLVLDNNALYMQRYWQYEVSLADKLNTMAGQGAPIDVPQARKLLEQLFSKSQAPNQALTGDNQFDRADVAGQMQQTAFEVDWQKVAVCLAASQRVSVITGGPGTGKTTTVIRLMALLQGLARGQHKRLQIKLAAPTGKAAARLSQSVSGAMQKLPADLQQDLPTQCSTLHRLLGSIPNSPYFRFNARHPLHVDVLIVDEASMVDLPLMSKLFAALPEHAKIVLLGDKDQLASVEAGSVLSDICAAALDFKEATFNQPPPYSSQARELIKRLCEIDLPQVSENKALISNSLALLHKSYRFSETSGIGRLARAVNGGQLKVSQGLFADPEVADIRWQKESEPNALVATLMPDYERYYAQVAQVCEQGTLSSQGDAVFALLQQQQVLCAQKEGKWGVKHINGIIESQLHARGLIDLGDDFYIGRPLMLKQNDHSLGLFNGDIGIVMPDGQNNGLLKVWFVTPDNTLRGVLPSRLPPHETVYAMTIHKSQGSEFERVYLCLPRIETRSEGRLLSRELIYTGLTRAKTSFILYSDEQGLSLSISRRCQRGSGLAQRLIE